jgi:Tfp pilus assembly protein PilN
MPSINMIAARRAEKRRMEQKTKGIIYCILAEGGLFLVALSFMVLQLITTQGQAGDLKYKIAKLKTQVDQIQALQQQTAELQPKLTALNSARDNTLYWYTALQNTTSSLSTTSWLSSISTSGDPSGALPPGAPATAVAPPATLLIAGSSISQADVGLTMLRMNQFPQFDHVMLNFVQQQDALNAPKTGINPVQFQMAIQLHPTAQPKAAAKTGNNDNVQKS